MPLVALPAAGTRWRPAQCLFRGAARPPARTRQGKDSVGYDGHSVTDSTFPMPLVAQLAAGFGSLAVRSIRNAAEWTLDTWCATVDAHPGWRRRACPGRIQSSGGLWGPRTEARLQPGAGPRSTAVRCRRFARASGKTAEWTRTPGFRLWCHHVNPRTYRTAERVWRPIAYFY